MSLITSKGKQVSALDQLSPYSTLPNASIWPIQLRDPSPMVGSSRKLMEFVDIKDIDFEDVSNFLDFAFLSQHLLKSSDQVRRLDSGKRGLSAPQEPPRKKVRSSGTELDTEYTTLIDTKCAFRVHARDASDSDIVLQLKEQLGDSKFGPDLNIDDLHVEVVKSLQSRPEDSIIGHHILLRRSGRFIGSLPVLLHDSTDHTNSIWLQSLSNLVANGYLTIAAQLALSFAPPGTPSELDTAGSLFLNLRLIVQAPISKESAAPLASNRILDMARIVRFAQDSQATKSVSFRQSVDADFIYQNLRPAQLDVHAKIQHTDLTATLLPFQQKSTAFLLGREGQQLDSTGQMVPVTSIMAHDGPTSLGLWWSHVGDTAEGKLFYNWIEARFITNTQLSLSSNMMGAMLAEEMGLGKTLEVISLILLNPNDLSSSRPAYRDHVLELDMQPVKTTLIVAPESLRNQWVAELQRHAPTLVVYSYTSRTKAEAEIPDGSTWEQFAMRFDVMIISYAILSRELNTAKSERHRSRRQERKYERPRSPLVKLHFRRVVMDEVQMVGNSSAAETASMIARDSSIAVSGTPVKKVEDLRASFRFLRVPGYLASAKDWDAIFHPLLAPELVRVLRIIATRHTKVQVDLSLPTQYRAVVPIDFTSIETAFYDDVWKAALLEIGSSNGDSVEVENQLDFTKMRDHLLLLRQACTNPQIVVQFRGGVVGTRNLLRSIDEVLELMIASSNADLSSQRYNWFERRILKAILSLYLKDEDRRILAAAQFADLRKEIELDVGLLEEEIRQARSGGLLYAFTADELHLEDVEEARRRRIGYTAVDLQDEEHILQGGEGSEAWQSLLKDVSYRERRKQRAAQTTSLKLTLRNLLTRLHRLLQFTGNLYFQRGEYMDEQLKTKNENPDEQSEDIEPALVRTDVSATQVGVVLVKSEDVEDKKTSTKLTMSSERQDLKDLEDKAYADSEKVRQRLLTESREEVETAINKLNRHQITSDASAYNVDKSFFENGGGVLSHDAYLDMAANCDLLNRHTATMLDWRDSILVRLRRPVNRDINMEKDDDDQYQDHLDTQAEAEVLLEMYRLLHSERERILKGAVAIGATSKPLMYKELEDAMKQARQRRLLGLETENEDEEELARVQEMQLSHFQKLDEQRLTVSMNHMSRSIVDVQDQLRNIRDNSVREEELSLARRAATETRRIVTEQIKLLDRIRNEEKTLLSPLFNLRTKYFKEIQALSDTVSDPVFTDLGQSIATAQREESNYFSKVQDTERRLRYLMHLRKVQSTEEMDEEAKRCVICTDLIETGILTNQCGHVCCEKCWKSWRSKGHRTCVMCQTRVLPNEVHRIVYPSAQRDPVVQPLKHDEASGGDTSSQPQDIMYNPIDGVLSARLERVATEGRFGSKIDQVTKHLKYIIEETGGKSLVFSSFKRGLDIVAQALTANGIRFVRLGSGKPAHIAVEAFRNDVPVMLLHSEVQSSGLNLVAAQHIHILEPLLNSTLELQAIGRVHRIGQTKETNVWCYYAKDTVEERILALAAYKGQSLYLQGKHTSLDSACAKTNGNLEMASKLDARNWAATSSTLRGDQTTSKLELQAVYFAQHLRKLQAGAPLQHVVRTASNKTKSAVTSNDMSAASGSSQPEEDEARAQMRRARLAAFRSS